MENNILKEIENIVFTNDFERSSYLASLIFKHRNRKISSRVIQGLHKMQLENEDYPVILHEYLVDPNKDDNFYMLILDIFEIKGKGTVVVGIVSSGTLNIGDSLILEKSDGSDVATFCQDIQLFDNDDKILPGNSIGVFLQNLQMNEIEQGDALSVY